MKPLLFAALTLCGIARLSAADVAVSVVTDATPGAAVRHGLAKIIAALEAKGVKAEQVTAAAGAKGGILLVAGQAKGDGPAATLLKKAGIDPPTGPEALVIQHVPFRSARFSGSRGAKADPEPAKAGTTKHEPAEAGTTKRDNGKPAVLVAGSDDRGLMYALLDIADRIGWATDPKREGDSPVFVERKLGQSPPLAEVRDIREKPAVRERALSMFTFQKAYFESRFFDERFWQKYLDTLAANRFNTFVLIFGYENWGYFSPPYPYFFDVAEFPDVRVVGMTKANQERHLRMLNRVIEMCHARGLNFTLGIWDHIYRGGVQGPTELTKKPTPGIVWGLTARNLTPYTKAALAKFLQSVHGIDAIQFRMHGESGLTGQEMPGFWNAVFDVMKTHGPGIRLDLRAKGLPDEIIDNALEKGLPTRICTKFWAEQMGLPFHPTHINVQNQFDRRHSFADLLRYPQRYKMHWRLWNGGTQRVLLWGDPDYVRRFVAATKLYDGDGFEVNEPLCTKMQDQPHDTKPFELLNPKYRYYDYEFERYWHFFQCWGRVGYNPDTPPEVWHHEFQRRFGPEAGPLVEKALHEASKILPRITASIFPYSAFPMTRGWAEKQTFGDLPHYAKAGVSDTEQFLTIEEAAKYQIEGIESAKIAPEQNCAWFWQVAGRVAECAREAEWRTADRHGKEFLATLADVKMLQALAAFHAARGIGAQSYATFASSNDAYMLDRAIQHEDIAVHAWEFLITAAGDLYAPDLMMGRRTAGLSGHWKDEIPLLRTGLEKLLAKRRDFRAKQNGSTPTIAHTPIRKIVVTTKLGDVVPTYNVGAVIAGPEPISAARLGERLDGGKTEYFEMYVPKGQHDRYVCNRSLSREARTFSYFIEATDRSGQKTTWPPGGAGKLQLVMITDDLTPPALEHVPITTAPGLKAMVVSAHVRDTAPLGDPSGVKWVRLRYRSVNQFFDYRTLAMQPTGHPDEYRAEVPGEHLDPRWDFQYFFEVMDNAGNGKIYPDLDKETPYIVVKLRRDAR